MPRVPGLEEEPFGDARGLPYVATLRVYEPIEALGPEFAGRPGSDPAAALIREREESLRRLIAAPPRLVPEAGDDELLIIEVDGRQFGAPTRVRLRCWTAMEELCNNTSDPLLDAFFPRPVIDQAERDFATWRAENPTVVPHIRSKPWQVPLSWFVPFSHGEREHVHERLIYRTGMTEARRRVVRSLATLRRAVSADPLVEAVVDVGRWLESFHPFGLVELDYGGLAALRPMGVDGPDESATDVHAALAALAAGDMQEAVQRYGRLVKRWRCYAEYAHFS